MLYELHIEVSKGMQNCGSYCFNIVDEFKAVGLPHVVETTL